MRTSTTMTRQKTCLLTAFASSLLLLPIASAAFTGCLGVCVANNGCSTTSARCICSASSSTSFLGNVVECVAELCLLGSSVSVDDAISAIDKQFLEVVDSQCASDDLDVPASRISSALSVASSIVSSILGGGGAATTTTVVTTTPTTSASTTTQKTQTTAARTTSSSSSASSTSTSSKSISTSSPPSTSSAILTSSPSTPSPTSPTSSLEASSSSTLPVAASSPDTTETAKTTQPTSTTKQKSTSTKAEPAVDTTDSSPFTNTNSAASAIAHSGNAWRVATVAALPMLLSMAVRLI